MSFCFPRVYPILDSSTIPSTNRADFLHRLAAELADAGLMLLEYRNKTGTEAEILTDATILRAALPAGQVKLILDDRADLVEGTGFDGVHLDAGDESPADARKRLGPARMIGAYGGTESLLPGVLTEPADYFAIGPVYPTTTKETSKRPIGPAGVRKLRQQAGPTPILVAVGGVTLGTAAEVLAAGASTIAVSAAIFRSPDPAAEFRLWKLAFE